MKNILIYSREKSKIVEEVVYGGSIVRFFYSTRIGLLLEKFIALPLISELYGGLQSTKISRLKVPGFVQKFDIKMSEFEDKDFVSFNDFFIRNFKDGQREFVKEKSFPAFCEGRYLGYESCSESFEFPVKSSFLSPSKILKASKYKGEFEGGPVLVARLCPVDYHCYHYPAKGKTLEVVHEGNELHSVNPWALKSLPDLFIKNKRRVSILETDEFGLLAFVEVGATCVGKIIQTHDESEAFERGQKKGHFLFGGSTVILFGQKGKWRPSDDVLKHTLEKREVLIKLGQELGQRL